MTPPSVSMRSWRELVHEAASAEAQRSEASRANDGRRPLDFIADYIADHAALVSQPLSVGAEAPQPRGWKEAFFAAMSPETRQRVQEELARQQGWSTERSDAASGTTDGVPGNAAGVDQPVALPREEPGEWSRLEDDPIYQQLVALEESSAATAAKIEELRKQTRVMVARAKGGRLPSGSEEGTR